MNRQDLRHLAIFLAALISGAAMAGEAEDHERVLQTEQRWLDATVTGNRQVLETILAPSFVDTTPNGIRRSRNQVMTAPPPPKGSTQQFRDVQVTVVADTAIVTGINVFTAESAAPVEVAFTDTFIRQGNSWKALASHLTYKKRETLTPQSR